MPAPLSADVSETLPQTVRIGTRGSPLALAQANDVRRRLIAAHPHLSEDRVTIEVIKTTGDLVRDRPLAEIGGKGLFTKEIEEALLSGAVDIGVHSTKDMPTVQPDGLALVAFLEREDPRDALIGPYARIADLPPGAVIGTASVRRQAQLLAQRPDLRVVMLRGNVDTRLRKVAEGAVAASFLAMAGLNRLGLAQHGHPLTPAEMLPAPAQGAVCIEARAGDPGVAALLAPLNHADTADRVAAERAMLAVLDGSCRTPIGGLALLDGETLRLEGLVVNPDGTNAIRLKADGPRTTAAQIGTRLGRALLDAARVAGIALDARGS